MILNSFVFNTPKDVDYKKICTAAKHLWFLYSDGVEMFFTWEDLTHEILAKMDFDCSQIGLFSYRFKQSLTKEKVKQYVYNKYLKQYAYYFDASMPDQDYPDFPVGEDIETCIKFLVKKLGRPITCKEAVYHIRKEDYTKYFLKCDSTVKAALRKMDARFSKMNLNKRLAVSGLNNPNAKLTPDKQTEAKRLFEIWGKKYKAIGSQIGVSKDTARQFLNGNSYNLSIHNN